LGRERVVRALVEEHKPHFIDPRLACLHCFQRYPSCIIDRPAIDAGRDGRERHGGGTKLVGNPQRIPEAVREQLRLVFGLRIRRPYGVDHPARLQSTRGCRHGLAGRQSVGILVLPELLTLSQNLGSTPTMYRAVNPAAAQQ
jgi:hypothetical protein